jgi:hypothetical protein
MLRLIGAATVLCFAAVIAKALLLLAVTAFELRDRQLETSAYEKPNVLVESYGR